MKSTGKEINKNNNVVDKTKNTHLILITRPVKQLTRLSDGSG